jgi:hypothetical protein
LLLTEAPGSLEFLLFVLPIAGLWYLPAGDSDEIATKTDIAIA